MNKGEVLAIAGKPDHEESYYQGAAAGLSESLIGIIFAPVSTLRRRY